MVLDGRDREPHLSEIWRWNEKAVAGSIVDAKWTETFHVVSVDGCVMLYGVDVTFAEAVAVPEGYALDDSLKNRGYGTTSVQAFKHTCIEVHAFRSYAR